MKSASRFLNFALLSSLWAGIILISQMRKLRLEKKINNFERLASNPGFPTPELVFFYDNTTFMSRNASKLEQIIGRNRNCWWGRESWGRGRWGCGKIHLYNSLTLTLKAQSTGHCDGRWGSNEDSIIPLHLPKVKTLSGRQF